MVTLRRKDRIAPWLVILGILFILAGFGALLFDPYAGLGSAPGHPALVVRLWFAFEIAGVGMISVAGLVGWLAAPRGPRSN